MREAYPGQTTLGTTSYCGFQAFCMDFLSPVHTAPEKFENAALFLRLGLPYTLIRHENEVFNQTGGIWKHRFYGRHFEMRHLLNIIRHLIFEYENNFSILVCRLHIIASHSHLIPWAAFVLGTCLEFRGIVSVAVFAVMSPRCMRFSYCYLLIPAGKILPCAIKNGAAMLLFRWLAVNWVKFKRSGRY